MSYPGGYTMTNVRMPGYKKYESDGFATPSGKMEFDSVSCSSTALTACPYTPSRPTARRPRRTWPGNSRWCSTPVRALPMFIHSRTFRNPWNLGLAPEPFIGINPEDAAVRGIADNDRVVVATPRSTVNVRARLTNGIVPGAVSIYHGWTTVEVNELIDPDYLDPISGFPGFKSLLCQVIEAKAKGELS